jgi:hypothetical protein
VEIGKSFIAALREAVLDHEVLADDVTLVAQAPKKPSLPVIDHTRDP